MSLNPYTGPPESPEWTDEEIEAEVRALMLAGADLSYLDETTVQKYSDTEARDDHGRWTNGGGDIKTEPSPLDYHGEHPQRFAIYDDTASPSTDTYHQVPGLVAFLDWSPGNRMGSGGAFIHYMHTRDDYQGKGMARALIQHLYDTVPGDIDWGDIMSDQAEHLWRDFDERYPDRWNHGKIR